MNRYKVLSNNKLESFSYFRALGTRLVFIKFFLRSYMDFIQISFGKSKTLVRFCEMFGIQLNLFIENSDITIKKERNDWSHLKMDDGKYSCN